MNISSKTIFASALLAAVFAASTANAEGRAGDLTNSAVQSVEVKKVSLQSPAPIYVGINR